MSTSKSTLVIRIVLLTGTLVSLFFVPWILVKAWLMPLPDTVQEQVDEALGYGFDGMIVYVQRGEAPPVYHTGGWHDKRARIPAKPDALFKIASISKLYVAVSITKLAAAKQLALDDTLTDYYPELSDRIAHADSITIRMLVQHRSGIPNFTDNPAFWEDEQKNSQRALDFALDLPANFLPDEDYGYSNTNYLLLRGIIDKVLGYSHHTFIREKILSRLGLNDTYFSIKDVDIDRVMSGYYVGIDEDFKTNENGMLATASDVGQFIRALNDGSVFDGDEQAIYANLYEYGHGGLVPGYQSLAEYHRQIDTVVVQFINTTDFEGFEWNLSQIIFSRIEKILKD